MNHIKILAFLIALSLTATLRAAPPAGDPLPRGVVARLGSSQFTHSANVDHVAFAADGKTVVFVGRDSVVGRWDMAGGKELGRVQLLPFGVRGLLLSPDGTTVAQVRSNQGVAVIDVAAGKERFTVPRRGAGVLGWGKNGQTLLISTTNEVHVWDVAAGRELAQWKTKPSVTVAALAGSADGTRVAVYSNTNGT